MPVRYFPGFGDKIMTAYRVSKAYGFRRILVGAIITVSMVLPSQAQTTSDPETRYILEKYIGAYTAQKVEKKCEGTLNVSAEYALNMGTAHYKSLLSEKSGQSLLGTYAYDLSNMLRKRSCNKVKSDPHIQTVLQSTGLVVDEYWAAIARSGLKSCGPDYKPVVLNKVLAVAKQADERVRQRPDAAFTQAHIQEHAAFIAGHCASPITGHARMLVYTPYGQFFDAAYRDAKR